MSLFLFELYSRKLGNGRYLVSADDYDSAFKMFENDVYPKRVIRDFKGLYFEGDLLLPEGSTKPDLEWDDQPRRCWIIGVREIAERLIEWD